MRKYIRPEITVKSFFKENIVTDSTTAVKQAEAAAEHIVGSQKTFKITW